MNRITKLERRWARLEEIKKRDKKIREQEFEKFTRFCLMPKQNKGDK